VLRPDAVDDHVFCFRAESFTDDGEESGNTSAAVYRLNRDGTHFWERLPDLANVRQYIVVAAVPTGIRSVDGFESGGTSAWSAVSP
jgi:hypothetical protein